MTPAPSDTAPPPIGSDLAAAIPDADRPPSEGDPIARIDIPAIGVEKTIVQGVQRQTLRAGPGHYPSTPMPGQPGNTAIAGHRTTHGAPFLDIDRLEPGDHIEVETADGLFRYAVEGHEVGDGTLKGHIIVRPSDVGVIGDQGDDRLTLTACHPRYSARERIIVTAVLVGEPPPEPVVVAEPPVPPVEEGTAGELAASLPGESPESGFDPIDTGDVDPFQTVDPDPISLEKSLGWRMEELDPAVLWGTITALVIHAGWVLGLLWRRRWAYAVTTPLAVAPLFVCFIHLDRLLPAF
jgi:sortase A